jgi:hypothetical protein
MKLTKSQLKQIIKEELGKIVELHAMATQADDNEWLTVEDLLSAALAKEELKGYGYVFKRMGSYPLDSLKKTAEQGDPMAPEEFNDGMRWAIEDIEHWNEDPEKQSFTKWLSNSDRLTKIAPRTQGL